jgi:hypothetical protein
MYSFKREFDNEEIIVEILKFIKRHSITADTIRIQLLSDTGFGRA